MRILADENVEPNIIDWLRQTGHEVVSVRELGPGTADADLLGLAVAADRVLLTYDTDFGDLVHRRQMPHVGVVLLRLAAGDPADRLAVLQAHWPSIEVICQQRFIVVRDNRLRIGQPVNP